jgi:O-antigen/teichoic acid export membrane protein
MVPDAPGQNSQRRGLRQIADEAQRGLRRRLLLGFAAQGFTSFVVIGQQLVLIPIFLIFWGNGVYSDWLVLAAAADCLRLIEFGFHFHAGNLLRMAWARGELAQYKRALKVGLAVYSVILGASGLLLFPLATMVNWPTILGTTTLSHESATLSLVLLSISTLLMLPRNIIIAVYDARGDFGRGQLLNTLYVLVLTCATSVALMLDAAPPLIALIQLVTTILVGWVVLLMDQARRYQQLDLGVALPTRQELVDLLAKARHYSVSPLSEIVLTRAPILLLGMLASNPLAIIVFAISRTFTGVVRQIAPQFARVAGIELSRQHAQEDVASRTRLYLRMGELIGGLVGLLSGFTIAISEDFISLWTRGQVPFDGAVVGIFVAAIFITAPGQISAAGLQYISIPRPLAVAALLQTAITMVLCIVLIPIADASGAAFASAAGEVVAFGLYIPIVAGQYLQVGAGPFLFRAYTIGLIMTLASYLMGAAAAQVVDGTTVVGAAVLTLVWLVPISGLVFFFLLTRDQRHWLIMSIGNNRRCDVWNEWRDRSR